MKLRSFSHCIPAAFVLCIADSTFNATAQQSNAEATNHIETASSEAGMTGLSATGGREARFRLLQDKMDSLKGNAARSWDGYEQVVREMMAEFPRRPEGYQNLMVMIQLGEREKAKVLAKEMAESSAPEHFRSWARGFLHRADSIGKPLTIKFTSLDGREVDTAKLKGKVVLIDFWATYCGPCVAALPEIKSTYDKFHSQGFEVIGISLDIDKSKAMDFIKQKGLPWPQYFDGKRGADHKLAQELGIVAIPHTMLLDKKGCLRLDHFLNGSQIERHVTRLLSEP